jgi:hypothetical protein
MQIFLPFFPNDFAIYLQPSLCRQGLILNFVHFPSLISHFFGGFFPRKLHGFSPEGLLLPFLGLALTSPRGSRQLLFPLSLAHAKGTPKT